MVLGNEQLTIIALGKFGGREISYGTDLDVVFVGEDNRAAQSLIAAMVQPTAEGNIWPLDARLRPEGDNGPLVCSIETFQGYYANRAQLWEMQALTRARAISGPLKDEFMEVAKAAWRRAGQDPELLVKIDGMLERIRLERGSGSDFLDLKTGTGGIIEGEFLLQALAMAENVWDPNSQRALDRLRERGLINDAEARTLKQSYGFLRQCESALRRYENKTVSSLPNDPAEQRRLAIRLGYVNLETFRRAYIDARESIHAIYQRHVACGNHDSASAFQQINASM
jgi:glutamate-ammonia-ligase adenylyltransferase